MLMYGLLSDGDEPEIVALLIGVDRGLERSDLTD